MPYAVWVDISSHEATGNDEIARAQLPGLIEDLMADGWEVTAPETDADNSDGDVAVESADDEESGPPDLLDMRVLTYPNGVFVGLAVDTDSIEVALAIGTGLGRHLRNAAPALMGWTVDSIRADTLTNPYADDEWLPPMGGDPQPHFPPAEHLASELQDLCAQYLIAGSVVQLLNPTLDGPHSIDPTDVIAGAATEHPWSREVAGALGALLIAAGRHEHDGGQRSIASRGEGDPAVAQALLDLVRREIDTPFTGYDDDRMRGHVVLEEFMEQHKLTWNRVDSDLDTQTDERHSRTQLRALLWAGFRALATMTSDLANDGRSGWLWLAAVVDDDPVVELFAERDEEDTEASETHAYGEITAAAEAHLLVQIALLHPELLDPSTVEFSRLDLGSADAIEPLHHLVYQLLQEFGANATATVLASQPATEVTAIAEQVVPVLRAMDEHADDAYNDLHAVLEEILPDTASSAPMRVDRVRQVLILLSQAAHAAGPDQIQQAMRYLFRNPSEMGCVLVDQNDHDTDSLIRKYLLAYACGVAVNVAANTASRLPELASDDPRDEPALRDEAATWWTRLAALAGYSAHGILTSRGDQELVLI